MAEIMANWFRSECIFIPSEIEAQGYTGQRFYLKGEVTVTRVKILIYKKTLLFLGL